MYTILFLFLVASWTLAVITCRSIELDMGDLKEKLKKYCSRNIDGSYDHEQIISVRRTSLNLSFFSLSVDYWFYI